MIRSACSPQTMKAAIHAPVGGQTGSRLMRFLSSLNPTQIRQTFAVTRIARIGNMNLLKSNILILFTVALFSASAAADSVVADGETLKGNEAIEALKLAKEAAKLAAETISEISKFEEEYIKYIESKPVQIERLKKVAKSLGKAVFGSHNPALRAAYIYEHTNQTGYSWGFQGNDFQDRFSSMCEKRRFGLCVWDWNDNASAIKTNGKTIMACYDHASYGGERIIVGPDESINLASVLMDGGNSWSDRISSCIVMQDYEALVYAFPGN